MDVAYINPFICSTRNVFDTMIHVALMFGRPYLQPREISVDSIYPISAAIGMSGSASGLIVLSLSETVALALASGLAQTTFSELNPDSYDALAEIVNMIAGNAKKDLPGGQTKLTVPTLLPTPDVVYPQRRPIIVVPFDTGVGRFLISIALRQNTAESSQSTSAAA
ncbi:MAG TPA: chemotaxis protein CheX [Tepidisphaeraceae bacterium]|nr:chemotaxis protein CheX [Tepidisphaeraceae bacterium]